MPLLSNIPGSSTSAEQGASSRPVAVLTGATSGIGLSCAEALCQDGFHCIICGRTQTRCETALKHLHARFGSASASYVAADAGTSSGIEQIVSAARNAGNVRTIVACAGASTSVDEVLGVSDEDILQMATTNISGPLRIVRELASDLKRENGKASVVFIGSIAGVRNMKGLGVYGVTKSALHALARTLGTELAPLIRVNAVAPGLIRTKFSRILWEGREEQREMKIPMKRLGTPADVAGVVRFLVSEHAAYVTGQIVVVDGGMTAKL